MPLKSIKIGRWYETAVGVGPCLSVGGTFPPSASFDIRLPFPRGKCFCKPAEVLREVPDPTAPE